MVADRVLFMQTTLSFANKKNRDCSKGYPCGASCISKTRNCGKKLNPTAKAYLGYLQAHANRAQADNFDVFRKNRVQAYLAQKRSPFKALVQPLIPVGTPVPGTPSASPSPQPVVTGTTTTATKKKTTKKTKATPAPTPVANIRTNAAELDRRRNELIQAHGQKAVEDAEKGLRQTIDKSDVFVAVSSSGTLMKILDSRFLNSFETGSEASVPLMRGTYADNRKRVEKNCMGIDNNTADSDRPIYGFLANPKVGGADHDTVSDIYGGITVKLKPQVKDAATFTGADSFKSGIASPLSDPNAASVVPFTKHGYQRGAIPGYIRGVAGHPSGDPYALSAAAADGGTDSVSRSFAPTGNAYMEVQIHRQVTPNDIAEIHYTKKEFGIRPTAEVVEFAKKNGVKIFVDGQEKNVDALLKSAPRVKDLSNRKQHKPSMTQAEAQDYTRNSVVRNITFYHGTDQASADNISTAGMKPSKNAIGLYGKGFYTSRRTSVADGYAQSKGYGGNPTRISVALDIRNPLVVQDASELFDVVKTHSKVKITKNAKAKGYDGIYVKDFDYWVVFDTEQVTVFDKTRV